MSFLSDWFLIIKDALIIDLQLASLLVLFKRFVKENFCFSLKYYLKFMECLQNKIITYLFYYYSLQFKLLLQIHSKDYSKAALHSTFNKQCSQDFKYHFPYNKLN